MKTQLDGYFDLVRVDWIAFNSQRSIVEENHSICTAQPIQRRHLCAYIIVNKYHLDLINH